MRHLGVLPGGRKWEYEISLPPAGGSSVIVLANPLMTDYHVWDDVVNELLTAGFCVLRFNMYGQGATECPAHPDRWTLAGLAQDFWHMFDFIALTKNGINFPVYAWIGVGLGGALGVQFATTHLYTIRNLVLVNTPPCSPCVAGDVDSPPSVALPTSFFSASVTTAAYRALAAVAANATPITAQLAAESCFHAWLRPAWLVDPANSAAATRVRESMSATSPQGLQAALAMLSGPEFDLRARAQRLASFVKRVRFIVGADDEQAGPRPELLRVYVEDSFTHRRPYEPSPSENDLVVLRRASHLCFIDGLEDFCQAIIPWLRPRQGTAWDREPVGALDGMRERTSRRGRRHSFEECNATLPTLSHHSHGHTHSHFHTHPHVHSNQQSPRRSDHSHEGQANIESLRPRALSGNLEPFLGNYPRLRAAE